MPDAVQFWAHMLDESFPENDDGVLRKCADKLADALRSDGCNVFVRPWVRGDAAFVRFASDDEKYTAELSIGEETLNRGLPDQEEHEVLKCKLTRDDSIGRPVREMEPPVEADFEGAEEFDWEWLADMLTKF